MNEQERKEQTSLPPCPNPNCTESHVVRNGSHRGQQRYHCRSCNTYFGATQGTPMYGLKTPAAEVAQALLIVMRALCCFVPAGHSVPYGSSPISRRKCGNTDGVKAFRRLIHEDGIVDAIHSPVSLSGTTVVTLVIFRMPGIASTLATRT